MKTTKAIEAHRTSADARCTQCGAQLDCATPTSGSEAPPKPGDLSVCLYCGVVLCFGDAMEMRAISLAEYQALPIGVRRELDRVQEAVARIHPSRSA